MNAVMGMPASQQPESLFDSLTAFLLLLGWTAYIIFAPIYVFNSGIPQPADYIIAIISGLSVVVFALKRRLIFNRVFACLCLMVGLFFIINTVYFLAYNDHVFFLSSIYYIFNALVFGASVILIKNNPEKTIQWARIGIFASLAIQTLWLIFGDSNALYRETGTFNNPNQLGYWALLSSCYLMIINYNRRMPWMDLIAFFLCAYIITEALSRAVIVSYALVLIVFFTRHYIGWMMKVALACCVLFYALTQVLVFNNPAFFIQKYKVVNEIATRIESIGTEQGALEERGYERILHYPQYLLFGAGEGAYQRFAKYSHNTLEMHSGLGTILFSYGIFGFLLFSAFIMTIFQRAPWGLWVTLAAVMAYGITHQHIRFTGFWLYLGFVYGLTRYVLTPRREGVSSHPPR